MTQATHLSTSGGRGQNVESSSSGHPSLVGAIRRPELNYDVGKFAETATYVKSAIYLTLMIMTVCLVGSITILAIGEDRHRFHFRMSEATSEVILFIVSFLVTICSDGLGYVHSTSLQWALYSEGRLEYNTNFRFFTSAKRPEHFANKLTMNVLAAASMLLSYASVSLLLVRSDYYATEGCKNIVNGDSGLYNRQETPGRYRNDFSTTVISLAGLGFGLLGQLVTASICLRHHEDRILSWNSNPLWNAYIMNLANRLERQSGRCMQSVFDNREMGRDMPVAPKRPGEGKRRLWHLPSTKWIVPSVWVICIISFMWPVIIISVTQKDYYDKPFRFRWDRMEHPDQRHRKGVYDWILNGSETTHNDFPIGVQYLVGILFLCGIQMLLLLGLHCVELLVNLSRDEHAWRKASNPSGSNPAAEGPLFAAVASWRTVFLTALKALLHWMIGQCVVPEYWGEVYDEETVSLFSFVMSASRLVFFGIVMLALASFATALAFWPIHGYQPVAWGHLQTLVNLVDDWGLPGSTLYWGGKHRRAGGASHEWARHAGTVGQTEIEGKLDAKGIRPNDEYGGRGCCASDRS